MLNWNLEQLYNWIDTVFLNNNIRAIKETDLRDGLKTQAQWVDERTLKAEAKAEEVRTLVENTNSDTYIQNSIGQAQQQVTLAQQQVQLAKDEKELAVAQVALANAQRVLTETARTETQAYALQVQTLVAQGYTPKGNWTIATNTPDLTTVTKAAGDAYIVDADGTTSITGTSIQMKKGDAVHWNAVDSVWIWRPNATIPADGSVSKVKLETYLQNLLGQLPADSPYLAVWTDAVNRLLMTIRKDGFIEGKFVIEAISMMANAVHTASIQNGAVTWEKLEQLVRDLIGETFDATDSEYLFLRLDTQNRIVFGIKKDGTIVGKFGFENVVVTEDMLTDELRDKINSVMLPAAVARLIEPNAYDVEVEDDGLWRGVEIEIPTKTEATGYGFAQFPPAKTKVLKGVNSTGTSLLFRKSNNLPIRGKRYRGTFDPTASGIVGTNLRGNYGNSYSNTYPAFPSGNTGDCWVIDCGNTTATKTANSLTFKNGDILVKTAGGYAIQPGPGDGTFQEGDFWNVSAAGTFGGLTLSTTGRLVMLGFQSQSGPKYVKYLVSKPGEFYLMGECDPGSFSPTTPRNGDLYTFSVAGTTQGVTGAVGDSLIYDGGWGLSAGQAVTVANGNAFSLPCERASEWEVRRVDKSVSWVSVAAKGYRTTVRRRVTDELLLLSDSMFGGGGIGSKILTATGRTGNVVAYGGGTSYDVLAMLRYHIRNGDPYAGRVSVIWHGQNNQTDTIQIKKAAYEMASLIGAYEKRFVFWSVLGQRSATWNGTRIVIAQHEDAKAGANNIAEIERFYEAAFPRQFYNIRKALLETAVGRNLPDPQFPSMTEAQVASTYGIVPFSYFFDFAGKPFTQAQLNPQGFHGAAGLPSGGANFDCYVRTGNGTIGQLVVNVAGSWIEYTHDSTHLSTTGADAGAPNFANFLTTLNI